MRKTIFSEIFEKYSIHNVYICIVIMPNSDRIITSFFNTYFVCLIILLGILNYRIAPTQKLENM